MHSHVALFLLIVASTTFVLGEKNESQTLSNEAEITEESLSSGCPLVEGYQQLESDSESGYLSAPGCPKSLYGHPWVTYGNPPRCYLVGERGPCGEEMKLGFRTNTSLAGYCKCHSCKDYPSELDEVYCHLYDKNKRTFTESLTFVKEKAACFPLFKKGPCGEGQVLSLLNEEPVCTEDKCNIGEEEAITTVFDPSDSTCKVIGSDCTTNRTSQRGETYKFVWQSVLPVCIKRSGGWGGASSIGGTRCTWRQLYSNLLKRCVTPLSKADTVG